MAALTIAGSNYEVRTEGARRLRPRRVGNETEAFDGTLRRTVRDTFHGWELPLAPLTTAQLNTLTALVEGGIRTCSGDLLGASYECSLSLSEAVAGEDEATGAVFWLVTVTLMQAE